MAVTRGGNTIRMTANGDAFAGRLYYNEIRFSGTGLTAGHLIEIKDSNDELVCAHYVAAANEDIGISQPAVTQLVNGVKLVTSATGTLAVTVTLR